MADWLFEVSVNSADADAAIRDFVKRTADTLNTVSALKINVDLSGYVAAEQKASEAARKTADATKAAVEYKQQLQRLSGATGAQELELLQRIENGTNRILNAERSLNSTRFDAASRRAQIEQQVNETIAAGLAKQAAGAKAVTSELGNELKVLLEVAAQLERNAAASERFATSTMAKRVRAGGGAQSSEDAAAARALDDYTASNVKYLAAVRDRLTAEVESARSARESAQAFLDEDAALTKVAEANEAYLTTVRERIEADRSGVGAARESAQVFIDEQAALDKVTAANERYLAGVRARIESGNEWTGTARTSASVFEDEISRQEKAARASETTSEALRREADSFDFLGRVATNSIYKLVEYELIMSAFNDVVHEVTSSLALASNVQFEQTLQRLYSSTINVNEALTDASIIARQWGSDITDVQQIIGLWTKNTNDLASATILANEAEKLHRASGIETQEVYRQSIALASQLGIKLGELPSVYDKVSEAALRVAVPMQQMGKGGKIEAIKDIFEGLSESTATLKAFGFDTAGVIAVVANQVQVAGENGKEAAKNLSSMFAALEGSGKHRKAFEDIISGAKDTDDLMSKLIKRAQDLRQAYADGELGVRPAQFETLQSVLASLEKIRTLRADIEKNSGGKLDLISSAQMSTALAQFDRLKASVQQFSLAIGKELLPSAMAFANMLNVSVLPAMTKGAPLMVELAKDAARLGVSIAALQIFSRAQSWLAQYSGAQVVAAGSTAELTAATGANAAATQSKMLLDNEATETTGRAKVATDYLAEALGRLQAAYATVAGEEGAYITETSAADAATNALALAAERGQGAMIALNAGLGAAVTGMGALAASAIRTIGPLAAAYTAVSVLQGAYASTQKSEQFELGLNQVGKNGLQNAVYGVTHLDRGAQQAVNVLTGRGNDPTNMVLGLLQKDMDTYSQGKAKPGDFASEIHHELAMKSSDPDWKDKVTGLLRQQYQDEQSRSYATDPSRQYQDMLAKAEAQAAEASKNGQGLSATVGAGSVPEPAYQDTSSGKSRGASTPEQDAAAKMQTTKNYYNALMTAANDLRTSYKDTADAEKDMMSVYGADEASVKRLSAAYDGQITATKNAESAAMLEAAAIEKQRGHLEALVATTKAHTTVHDAAIRQLGLADAAYIKASGAVARYRADVALLNAEKQKEVGTAQTSVDLGSAGLGQTAEAAKQKIEDIARAVAQVPKSAGLTGIVVAAREADASLTKLKATLEALLKGAKTGEERNQLQGVLNFLGTQVAEVNDRADAANEKIKSITASVADMSEKLKAKNGELADSIFGDGDSAQNAAQKEMLEGLREIFDERTKLKALADQVANDRTPEADHARDMIALANERLDTEAALLPILDQQKIELAQEKAIRESEAYKALSSGIEKVGDERIAGGVDRLLGLNANKKAGKNPFSDMVGQLVTKSLDDVMRNQVSNLLDKAFGIKKPKSAEDLAQLAAKNQTAAASTQLEAAKIQARSAEQFLEIATGKKSNASPATANGTVISDSPLWGTIAPDGQTVQVSGGPGTTSIGDDVDQATSGSTTASNTSTANDYLSDISDALSAGGGALGLLAGTGSKGGTATSTIGAAGAGISAIGGALAKNAKTQGQTQTAQTVSRIGSGISGIAETASGFESGGASGAIETGLGIFQTEAAINPALAASPVGIGIAAAGALTAGLLHHDNPADMPDKYNTQVYGQDIANLTGKAGANGQSFSEDYNLSSQLGGLDQIQYIEEYLAKGRPSDMTNQQYQNALAEFGASATGSGVLNHDAKNIGQVDVTGASGTNGKEVSYTQLESDASSIIAQALSKQTLAPIISMNAYGAGAGGATMNPSNLIGLNANETAAIRANNDTTLPTSTGMQTSPYATNGVGSSAPGATTSNPIYTAPASGTSTSQTINLLVDGKMLAQVVNAVNTDSANSNGSLAA